MPQSYHPDPPPQQILARWNPLKNKALRFPVKIMQKKLAESGGFCIFLTSADALQHQPTNNMTTTLPTLDQLRSMPLSEVNDFEGKKKPRTGATNAVKYKIADCSDDYASRAIVIDWDGGSDSPHGSRQIIRSCDAQWDQFIHRGC